MQKKNDKQFGSFGKGGGGAGERGKGVIPSAFHKLHCRAMTSDDKQEGPGNTSGDRTKAGRPERDSARKNARTLSAATFFKSNIKISRYSVEFDENNNRRFI